MIFKRIINTVEYGIIVGLSVAMAACGGGGGGSAAIQASVSSITSQNLFVGKKTGQILINGAELDNSMQVSITGCDASTKLSVQSNQITYQCTINPPTSAANASKTIDVMVKRADGQLLKTQQFTAVLPEIQVDRIELIDTPPLVYSTEITPPPQLVRFKIYGKNLDAGVRLAASCSDLKTVTSAETEREYTCDLKDTTDYDGELTFTVSNNADTIIRPPLNIPVSYPLPNPSVTAFSTASTIRYGAKARFNVTGENLSALIMLSDCTTSTVVSVASDKKSAMIDCEFAATKDKTVFTLQMQRKDGMVLLAATQDFTPPKPKVVITTSGAVTGTMTIELEPSKAPISVNNFLRYVAVDFYSNLIFHRVIKGATASDFSIDQGGGYTKGTTALMAKSIPSAFTAIKLEPTNTTGLSNTRGTIAMARSNDAHSATSQFYFNVQNNLGFNYVSDMQPGYAVFGQILASDAAGLTTMDNINAVATGTFGTDQNVPNDNIVIDSVVQTQ